MAMKMTKQGHFQFFQNQKLKTAFTVQFLMLDE